MKRSDERGETLVETIVAIVLLGAITSAWFYTASTHSKASTVNKKVVVADIVLRDYAEAAKAAVRGTCSVNDNSGSPFSPQYTPPSGFTVKMTLPGSSNLDMACPTAGSSPSAFVKRFTLTTSFDGLSRSLNIDVRSP